MANINKQITPVSAIKHADDKRAAIPTTEQAGEENAVLGDEIISLISINKWTK